MISKAELIDNIADRKSELRYKRGLIKGLQDSILRLETLFQNEEKAVINHARKIRKTLQEDCSKLESTIDQLQGNI
jgi:predicted  nucleic acid-binding Zn-ribbon protein